MTQPTNLLKKKLRHKYFSVNLTKFSSFFSTQVFTDHLRPTTTTSVLHCFQKFWLKKLFEWFSSISETYLCRLSQSLSAYCYLKMLKFLQCYRQPGAPRKRSVPLVNDHPAIVDIFQKFFENDPCIQTISFLVTMVWFFWLYVHLARKIIEN